MNSSELLELGREAADRIASEIRAGANLVHCQLLASQFYEALKLRFEEPRVHDAGATNMAAALRQCLRASDAHISPQRMLVEFMSALATLEGGGQRPPGRPVLRVIEGGLARSV
ncbi:MAG: hypothetical protein ACJ8D4_05190 [Xanthobacteraceae bacterium]